MQSQDKDHPYDISKPSIDHYRPEHSKNSYQFAKMRSRSDRDGPLCFRQESPDPETED